VEVRTDGKLVLAITSLDGVWVVKGGSELIITVSGNRGIITSMKPNSGNWLDAMNKGYVKIGDQFWRNLKST